MQLKSFEGFLRRIMNEANRLQRLDVSGNVITKARFTDSSIIAFVLGILASYFLSSGFSKEFAGYIISFLGIFIGLFTTIIISLYEKKDTILKAYEDTDTISRNRLIRVRNYMLQFTTFISYSIVVAIIEICLLLPILLTDKSALDTNTIHFISSRTEFSFETIKCFGIGTIVYLHRFVVIYYLSKFLFNTFYAVTSYSSFLISEYKTTVLIKQDEKL